MPIKPLNCMFGIKCESIRWTVKSFMVQTMLFAQRCLSTWRQILGAGVARGFDPACRQYSSEGAATLGIQESLEQIRSRIFGTHIGNGLRSGRKVLRKRLIGDKIASYYPEPVAKYDPMFVDMNIERCTSYSWPPVVYAKHYFESCTLHLILSPHAIFQEEAKTGQAQTKRESTTKEGTGQACVQKEVAHVIGTVSVMASWCWRLCW